MLLLQLYIEIIGEPFGGTDVNACAFHLRISDPLLI